MNKKIYFKFENDYFTFKSIYDALLMYFALSPVHYAVNIKVNRNSASKKTLIYFIPKDSIALHFHLQTVAFSLDLNTFY